MGDIWLYVARESHNIEIANRVVDGIAGRFELLARYPAGGRAREDLGSACAELLSRRSGGKNPDSECTECRHARHGRVNDGSSSGSDATTCGAGPGKTISQTSFARRYPKYSESHLHSASSPCERGHTKRPAQVHSAEMVKAAAYAPETRRSAAAVPGPGRQPGICTNQDVRVENNSHPRLCRACLTASSIAVSISASGTSLTFLARRSRNASSLRATPDRPSERKISCGGRAATLISSSGATGRPRSCSTADLTVCGRSPAL